MKYPVLLPLIFILTLLTACVTTEDSGGFNSETVVEKSKIKQPAWVMRKVGILYEDDLELSSVDYKSDILNLPVGIREAQAAARLQQKNQVVQKIQNIFKQKTTGLSEKDLSDLNNLIVSQSEPVLEKKIKVKDLYYEKLVGKDKQNSFYYRIFVLTSFLKTDRNSLYSAINLRLKRHRNKKLRKLTEILKA